MNLTDAYLVGSYTEFLVLMPYVAKAHEKEGLIMMRKRALGEVKRILNDNEILANVVEEISDLMAKLEEHPERVRQLEPQDILELGKAASEWRREFSRELKSIEGSSS